MFRSRRPCPPEFRAEAVRLYHTSGKGLQELLPTSTPLPIREGSGCNVPKSEMAAVRALGKVSGRSQAVCAAKPACSKRSEMSSEKRRPRVPYTVSLPRRPTGQGSCVPVSGAREGEV